MCQVSYPIDLLIWLNMHRLGYHNCNDQYHNHVRGIVWTAIERRRDARLRHRQRIPQKKSLTSLSLSLFSLWYTHKITSTKLNIKLFSSSGGIKREKRTSTTTTTITTTRTRQKKKITQILINLISYHLFF